MATEYVVNVLGDEAHDTEQQKFFFFFFNVKSHVLRFSCWEWIYDSFEQETLFRYFQM